LGGTYCQREAKEYERGATTTNIEGGEDDGDTRRAEPCKDQRTAKLASMRDASDHACHNPPCEKLRPGRVTHDPEKQHQNRTQSHSTALPSPNSLRVSGE
jgi:hypothetical protein